MNTNNAAVLLSKIGPRPLTCFDIESSGTNVATDRIVTLAAARIGVAGNATTFEFKINPHVTMKDEVIAVHGITNEMAAEWLPFEDQAEAILEAVNGCDLLGFNLQRFDIPILWEEFYRAGIEWDLDGVKVLDASTIFMRKEERTLSAAAKFFLGKTHEGAHDAMADVDMTVDVFVAQLQRYSDLTNMSLADLAEFSRWDNRIDLAGKIVVGEDGRPTYNLGKVKGTAVEDDTSFGRWMLSRDFPAHTRMVLEKILEEIEDRREREWQESNRNLRDGNDQIPF